MGIKRFNRFFKSLGIALLLIGALCTPRLIMAASTTAVSLNAPDRVSPGQTFTVDINVAPGAPLAGLQLNLSYDASILSVVEVQEGNLLSQGGAATYFQAGTQSSGSISGITGVIITPGASVSNSGVFAKVTFTAGQGGATSLTLSEVIAGDVNGQSLSVSATGDQVGINQPPVMAAIGDKTINEGQLLQFTVSASDADGDTLTYSAIDLPSGATFDAAARSFRWTPSTTQSGAFSVTFQASDGLASVQETITITVNKVYEDWDVNMDGKVNVLDLTAVRQHWGQTGAPGWIREDVNKDGAVNVLDMTLIGQHWKP